MSDLLVRWIDDHREPKCPADPFYPAGVDLDVTTGGGRACSTALPYPAPRCGKFLVSCSACGLVVLCTTAGRADDPRSIKVSCRSRF